MRALQSQHRHMVGRGPTASEPTTPTHPHRFHNEQLPSLPRSADGGIDETEPGGPRDPPADDGLSAAALGFFMACCAWINSCGLSVAGMGELLSVSACGRSRCIICNHCQLCITSDLFGLSYWSDLFSMKVLSKHLGWEYRSVRLKTAVQKMCVAHFQIIRARL